MRLDLDKLETAALLNMLGLASSVMRHDGENVDHFASILTSDIMATASVALIQKVSALSEEDNRDE